MPAVPGTEDYTASAVLVPIDLRPVPLHEAAPHLATRVDGQLVLVVKPSVE